ncbi:MAG: amino acid ABC transporter permease [Syntrophobacteraceae bacterium]
MKSLAEMAERPIAFWRVPEVRAIIYQALALAALATVFAFLAYTTIDNLQKQNIATGFGFLSKESGFGIGEMLIPYSPLDSYGRALVVGFLNTLKVAGLGIALTVMLGTMMGIARLSRNGLVAGLATAYVELIRNVPVLLQLFFWYALFRSFPSPAKALQPVPDVFLCNRGLMLPFPHIGTPELWVIVSLPVAIGLWRWASQRARARRELRGHAGPESWLVHLIVPSCLLAASLAAGASWRLDVPMLQGRNFLGGTCLSPEFNALLLGLVIYTGAFVAEIVRSGILSVDKGQIEAAKSIGLKRSRILRLVVLPQALRVIIPPLTNQMLNLTKNSSLAVAVGYPDLMSVANTTLNQTGQAIEGITLIMIVYLAFSLLTSAFMNWYNRRQTLRTSQPR